METGLVTVVEPLTDLIPAQAAGEGVRELQGSIARKLFREFFRNFSLGNIFIYRESLFRQWSRNEYFVEVNLAHVQEFHRDLFNCLQVFPFNKSYHIFIICRQALYNIFRFSKEARRML